MARLSDDVILDVLCRLGVKDLLRFRCVSKSFCCSMDDSEFIKLHLSHSLKANNNRALIFCFFARGDYFSVSVDSLKRVGKLINPLDVSDEGKFTEMLGSCNGLVALFNREGQIALWNPSTRKSQMLPFNKIECLRGACCRPRGLVFGFGYNPNSDDYKLVRIIQVDSFDSEVMVYSLRTNSWGRIKDFPFYLKHDVPGILADNALHWVVSKDPESESQSFVVALDLETEEYNVVELPDRLGDPFNVIVKAMGGCLCLSAHYWEENVSYGEEDHVIDIWMMKQYGVKESWTKLISLKKSLSLPDIKGVVLLLPLGFSKNGEKVLLSVDDNKLVWYDMKSKRIDKVRIRDVPSSFEVQMLVESLVPLNGNGTASATVNNKKKKQLSEKKQGKRDDDFLSKGFHLVL